MSRTNRFWGFYASPGPKLKFFLTVLPFVVIIAGYIIASDIRHKANPQDKLLPSITQMVKATHQLAFVPDRRTKKYVLWTDTAASLQRIGIGVVCATFVGLMLGLNMALFRGFQSLSYLLITFISMIPPLAILPILFISFGVGEVGKVVLIFLGIFPIITRDIYLAVRKIPIEQHVKSLTLGASELALTYRIVLPQIIPRLLDTVRLSLGAGWLFLIASEAIAATEGLGYRIFLLRRYMAMDGIIPYVLWITLLGFTIDYILRKFVDWRYGWYHTK